MSLGNFGGGDGSESYPWVIEDIQDFRAIETYKLGYYKLVNNLVIYDGWIGLNIGAETSYIQNVRYTLDINMNNNTITFGENISHESLINSMVDKTFKPKITVNIRNGSIVYRNSLTEKYLLFNKYMKTDISVSINKYVNISNMKLDLQLDLFGTMGGIGVCYNNVEKCYFNIHSNNNETLTGVGWNSNRYIDIIRANNITRCVFNYDINKNILIDNWASSNSKLLKLYISSEFNDTFYEQCLFTGNIKIHADGVYGYSGGGGLSIHLAMFESTHDSYSTINIDIVNLGIDIRGNILNTQSSLYLETGNSQYIYNLYYSGETSLIEQRSVGQKIVYGEVRGNSPGCTSSFINKDLVNSNVNLKYLITKTDAELRDINTFKGWNFTDIWGIDQSINNGYPYLQWHDKKESLSLWVQGQNSAIEIPLYNVGTQYVDKLVFNAGVGLKEIYLVDVTDPKALPIRISTPTGIKALSR